MTTRITHIDLIRRRVFASLRKALPSYHPSTVKVGEAVHGPIAAVLPKRKRVRVKLEPSGVDAYVSFAQLTKHMKVKGSDLQSKIKVGQVLDGLFVQDDNVDGLVLCSFHPPKHLGDDNTAEPIKMEEDHLESSPDDFDIGEVVEARVQGGTALRLRLSANGCKAYLGATDVADDYSKVSSSPPEPGTTLRAVVIGKDKKSIHLSTRPSRLDPASQETIVDPEILTIDQLQAGQGIRGFVVVATDDKRRVLLGGQDLMAMVSSKERGDFAVGQLIKGTITGYVHIQTSVVCLCTYISVRIEAQKIKMTLLSPEELGKRQAARKTAADLTVGQEVSTTVERIESAGLFLRIEDSKVVGLCRKRHVSRLASQVLVSIVMMSNNQITTDADADVEQALEGIEVGDALKAVVLKVNGKKVDLKVETLLPRNQAGPSRSQSGSEDEHSEAESNQSGSEDDEVMLKQDDDEHEVRDISGIKCAV